MTLHMKTYILAAVAALVLIAPRTAVAAQIRVEGLNIDATTAGALSAGTDRDKLDAAITTEADPIALEALKGYATTGALAIATANLDETDPRAMRLYHYGDPDIQITPAGDFGFDPLTGSITGYAGTDEDIVLPYEINGVPVVTIGDNAFEGDSVLKTLTAPKTLTTIGDYAFHYSPLTSLVAPALTTIGSDAFSYSSLTTLTAPALTTIGGGAFASSSLTSLVAPSLTTLDDYAFANSYLTAIYYGGNQPTAGASIYMYAPANLTNYVTNPTATGWGTNFGGKPVVRLPLYADEVYIKGSLAATQPYVDNAISSIPAGSTSSIYTPIKPTTAALAITSTNDIYRITTSTAVAVTPDLSELTPVPANKIARWEVWLDCTGTNALDSTWDLAFDWSGSEPDLTVTGCYKFACSVVSGGKISIKQTYPTVYDFTRQGNMGPVGFLAASTNATMIIALAVPDVLTYCVVYIKNNVSDLVYAITTPAYSKVGQNTVTTIKEQAIPAGKDTIVFMDKFTTADSLWKFNANVILLWSLEKTGTMNTSQPRCWAVTRPANELEIKAYEAGWRP